jgi:hypothetical protein
VRGLAYQVKQDMVLRAGFVILYMTPAEQGSLDEAIEKFQETLRLDPGNREAAENLQLAREMKAGRTR